MHLPNNYTHNYIETLSISLEMVSGNTNIEVQEYSIWYSIASFQYN